ncbi:hypothetical protein FCM35_KLT00676 [Carex littledalei]|uniref:Uncharacterized protein n=1 Tax=Carex littledalei TaxID=544730 RepID=A0A833RWW8_9POAL|nr:hypothetical protein FCM35_KLT00676 [Carex littledalei]
MLCCLIPFSLLRRRPLRRRPSENLTPFPSSSLSDPQPFFLPLQTKNPRLASSLPLAEEPRTPPPFTLSFVAPGEENGADQTLSHSLLRWNFRRCQRARTNGDFAHPQVQRPRGCTPAPSLSRLCDEAVRFLAWWCSGLRGRPDSRSVRSEVEKASTNRHLSTDFRHVTKLEALIGTARYQSYPLLDFGKEMSTGTLFSKC